jgi:hypothetical protein
MQNENFQEMDSKENDYMDASMRFAFECIKDGTWDMAPVPTEKRLRVLTSMLNWFESTEEYENCSVIQKKIQETEKIKSN